MDIGILGATRETSKGFEIRSYFLFHIWFQVSLVTVY